MRLTVTRIAVACILLLWVIIFPIVALRMVVQIPHLYTRWIQHGSVYEKLDQAITILIFRYTPEHRWSPWINRHPDVIHNLINLAVDKPTFERIIPQYLVCWVQWWLGEYQQPCRLGRVLDDSITPSQWENMRAYLWESLPSCTQASPPACKPVDTGGYAEHGKLQSQWWAAYRSESVELFDRWEKQAVTPLPETGIRKRVYNWVVMAISLLTLAMIGLVESKKRVTFLSLLFLGMGGSSCITGLFLVYGFVRSPMIGHLTGLNNVELLDLLIPQIWPMLAYLLGMTLILLGCLVMIPALIGLSAAVQQYKYRYIYWAGVIVLLACAFIVLPETVFIQAETLPLVEPRLTPTAWPTFTPTPTITPTPTPRSWPVSASTPLPDIIDVWWHEPKILRCTDNDIEQFDAIRKHNDELWIIQDTKHYRYYFTTYDLLAVHNIPRPFDSLILSPSGNFAALAEGRDVWFYSLPEWEPVVRSRVSTLVPVNFMLFTNDESHVVLGLDNGYIWVSDIQTGELVTLFAAHKSSVTALAEHHVQGRIYSGAADGTLVLWDYRNNELLQNLSGHRTAIHSIVPIQAGTGLVTLDITGRFIMWDVQDVSMIRERTVSRFPSSNLIWLETNSSMSRYRQGGDKGFIVAGTAYGQVFLLDNDFNYDMLAQFDSPVSFVYPVDGDYLVLGLVDGRLCIVGTPN